MGMWEKPAIMLTNSRTRGSFSYKYVSRRLRATASGSIERKNKGQSDLDVNSMGHHWQA